MKLFYHIVTAITDIFCQELFFNWERLFMRADRLLSIILLLQKHHHLTAHELARQLSVTERTIYRDIDALSLSGVPIYTQSGPNGGCFLDESYRTSLNWFTGDELQTLIFASHTHPIQDLHLNKHHDNALMKLFAQLPERYQDQVQLMQQRLYFDASQWYNERTPPAQLNQLKQIVWEDQLIQVIYESWNNKLTQITIAPYSLVYKAGNWYTVAQNQDTQQFRTYRISRLTDIRFLNQSFQRDITFDIATYWADNAQQFAQQLPHYPVQLEIKSGLRHFFRQVMQGRYEIIEDKGETLILNVSYTVMEEARMSVLGMGNSATVITPNELRVQVKLYAQQVIQHYQTIEETD